MATALDKVINEVMLGAQDPDSFLYGVRKPMVVQVAKRGYQELNFSSLNEPRLLTVDVPESGVIDTPVDYVELIRLSEMDRSGKLIPMYYDARKAIQYEYLRSNTGQLILDGVTGLPLKSYTPTPSDDIFEFVQPHDYLNTTYQHNYRYGQYYGLRGGYQSSAGTYRWEPESRKWYVEGTKTDKIFIEYLSDPLLRNDADVLEVNELYVEVLKNKMVYDLIKNKRSIALSQKQYLKREYQVSKKRADIRKNIRGNEIFQACRTQRGSYKF